MVRVFRFYVMGEGSFPFAMLCADQAWPATADDAEKITYACPTQAPRQTICLASYAHPTVARWREHKWPVHRVDA